MSFFRTFVEVRCWKCDIVYGMPETLHASRKRDGEGFFCPNGHEAAYKDTEADRLRRERDRLAQQLAQKDDSIQRQRELREAAERRAAAARGQVTKLKNRAGAGVCPCCTRSFTNLHAPFRSAEYEVELREPEAPGVEYRNPPGLIEEAFVTVRPLHFAISIQPSSSMPSQWITSGSQRR